MKKVMLLICLLVLTSTFNVVSQSGQPVPKETRGGVHDYAQVLDVEEIDSLNAIIFRYEQQTSNELAVAIINDDQYRYYDENAHVAAVKIFENWKIGKEGIDNGLLVVFYPNPPRDVNIEVGYGLEQYITDAIAGDLLDGAFIPVLQAQGNYEGLRSLLLAIIEKIGVRSAADIAQAVEARRQAEAQKLAQEQAEKERRAEARRKLWEKTKAFGPMAFILSVCALFILLLGHTLTRFVKKCQLRSQVRSIINDWESKLVNMPRITLPQHNNWPSWALKKGRGCIKQVDGLKNNVQQVIIQAGNLLENDPASAMGLLRQIKESDFQAVNRIFLGIPEEIAGYEREAPQRIAEAKTVLQAVKKTQAEVADQGFKTDSMIQELSKLSVFVQSLEKLDEPRAMSETAVELTAALSRLQVSLIDLPAQRTNIVQEIAKQRRAIHVLAEGSQERQATVKQLGQYADDAWLDVADNSQQISSAITQAAQAVDKAETSGNMQNQQFASALQQLTASVELIAQAEADHKALIAKLAAIKAAEKNYHSRIDVTTQAVAAAKVASNKDHAGTTSKSYYQTAQEKYDAMVELAQQSKVDWLAVVVLLDDASEAAGLACEAASTSISTHNQSILIAQRTMQSESDSNNRPRGGFDLGGGSSGGAGARRKGF